MNVAQFIEYLADKARTLNDDLTKVEVTFNANLDDIYVFDVENVGLWQLERDGQLVDQIIIELVEPRTRP